MTTVPKPIILIGGAALLAAVGFDTIAVIGRNIGLPLRGSIELVQAAVLVAGSIALLVSVIAQNHASVHLLAERLSKRANSLLLRAGAVLSALFFAGMLAGSLWLALDLWGGQEASELLGISYRLLRVFANVCMAAILLVFVGQALGRRG